MKRLQTMYISPVQNNSVQGRANYTYIKPDGTEVNAGRSFAKNVAKRYMFPRKGDRVYLKTNLSRMVLNPWFNKNPMEINDGLPPHYHVGADWLPKADELVDKEKISKQQELEIRFNLQENALTAKCVLDFRPTNRLKGEKANLLEDFTIVLYDRPNRFDNTSLRGCLAMELAQVNTRIATAKEGVNPSKHHFYISDENEELMEKNRRQDIIQDAITDLTLLRRKHTLFMRYKIGVLLSVVKGKVSSETLKEALNNFISTTSKSQIDNITRFNKLIELVNEGAEGVNELHIRYLIKQALDHNVIGSSGGNFTWYAKKGYDNVYNLGTNYNRMLKFFMDEELKYDEDQPEGNWFYELLKDLEIQGVQIEEK